MKGSGEKEKRDECLVCEMESRKKSWLLKCSLNRGEGEANKVVCSLHCHFNKHHVTTASDQAPDNLYRRRRKRRVPIPSAALAHTVGDRTGERVVVAPLLHTSSQPLTFPTHITASPSATT